MADPLLPGHHTWLGELQARLGRIRSWGAGWIIAKLIQPLSFDMCKTYVTYMELLQWFVQETPQNGPARIWVKVKLRRRQNVVGIWPAGHVEVIPGLLMKLTLLQYPFKNSRALAPGVPLHLIVRSVESEMPKAAVNCSNSYLPHLVLLEFQTEGFFKSSLTSEDVVHVQILCSSNALVFNSDSVWFK